MIEALIRPHIRQIVPYSTARDEFTGEAEIFLDANENPFPSPLNRYPDPHQRRIKALLSDIKRISENQIFIGSGSDEAIDLIVRIFAAPGESVTIMPPTYGMYKVAAVTNAVNVDVAPLQADFSYDISAIRASGERGSKVIFVCSPNNPTGNQFTLSQIEEILAAFPGVVVVDEAYIDFANEASAVELLEASDRLIVIQTFSKGWGLAGARLGMAFGAPVVVEAMNKTKLPYNISTSSQVAAIARLENPDVVREEIEEIISERERVLRELSLLPFVLHVYPSQGNFLLVRCKGARDIFQSLNEQGIIVRDRSHELHCDECLRITIGTARENDRLLDVLKRRV